jgi:phasin family protein
MVRTAGRRCCKCKIQTVGRMAGKVDPMIKNIDDVQKIGKDNMDASMKSFGMVSKSFQAIAVEAADYAKKAFEESTAATEKLASAKSLDKVMEVQTEYLKNAYEGFVAQSAKVGQLYVDLAQELYKPFESQWTKATAAK